jgi:hypothetical protein
MEASETLQQQPDAPAESQQQETPGGEEQSPDVLEQIKTLVARVDQPAAQQPQDDVDLATALTGDEQPDELEPEYDPYSRAEDQSLYEPGAEQFATPDELEGYLQERDDRLSALEARYVEDAENRNLEALDALTNKYEQLKDPAHVAKIRDVLAPLAAARGDESLVLDPRLVEAVHKSLMFDEASSREVPAEEAAARGATLETDAGVRQAEQERSYSEQKAEQILNAGKRSSTFT